MHNSTENALSPYGTPNGKKTKVGMPRIGAGMQPSAASQVVPESTLRLIPGTAEFRAAKSMPKILPSYDTGVERVPEDQVAQLHEGEAVLPVPEAEQYRQDKAEEPADKTVQAPHSSIEPSTSEPPQQLIQERGTPAERTAIKTDRQNAMGKGADGLKDLGLAAIHEAHLEPSTSDVAGPIAERPVGMPKIAPEVHQDNPGGPLISGAAPTSETPSELRDLRNMERNAKVQQLEKQRQDALASGDLTTADKLQVAKAQLEQRPWSDRSTLGKFGKIASTIGNIAGDVVAPGVTSLIPGTDMYKSRQASAAFNRITPDTEADLRESQVNAKESKADNYDVKEVLDNRKDSPTFGQTLYAGVNRTDPTDVRYSPLQTAPKAGGEKAETREQHLNRYAELKNQAESGVQLGAQDQNEFNTLKTELTVPKATMDSYNKQIDSALHAANVDQSLWSNYHVLPGATAEEAKQAIADAKSFSGETYQQGAEGRTMSKEERAQERKDKATTVYAEDENGQLVKTNKADADKRGLVSEEMKAGDISKDRSAMRQLNDVQTNVNRYEKAIAEDMPKISEEDRKKMTEILTIDNESGNGMLSGDVSGKGISIGGSVFPQWSAEVASRKLDLARADLKNLPPEAKSVLNAYLRTAASVPTYLKAIAGIGRSNKETLNLELANVPMPYYDQTTAKGRMSAFQDNVDQAKSGFPNNLPGMKQIESERSKGQKSAGGDKYTAPKPADVTNTGTYKGQTVYKLNNGSTVYANGKPVEVK